MIRITFGESGGRMTFRWSCDTCRVDDQAIDPDEGFDSIVWHLRRYHGLPELRDFTTRISIGLAATAQTERTPE